MLEKSSGRRFSTAAQIFSVEHPSPPSSVKEESGVLKGLIPQSAPWHSNSQLSACADLSLLCLGQFRCLKVRLGTDPCQAQHFRSQSGSGVHVAEAQLLTSCIYLPFHSVNACRWACMNLYGRGCLQSQSHFTEHRAEQGEAALPLLGSLASPESVGAGADLQVLCLSFPSQLLGSSGHGPTAQFPVSEDGECGWGMVRSRPRGSGVCPPSRCPDGGRAELHAPLPAAARRSRLSTVPGAQPEHLLSSFNPLHAPRVGSKATYPSPNTLRRPWGGGRWGHGRDTKAGGCSGAGRCAGLRAPPPPPPPPSGDAAAGHAPGAPRSSASCGHPRWEPIGTGGCAGGRGAVGGRGAPGRGAERSGGVCGAGEASGPARRRASLPAVSFGIRVPPRPRGFLRVSPAP